MPEAKICGICRQALRQGEDSTRIRLDAADITPETVAKIPKLAKLPAPGLYSCCHDCFDLFAPAVQARVEAKFAAKAAAIRALPAEFGGDPETKAEAFTGSHFI